MSSSNKPFVIFVLGGPGAGKGTQCGLIAKKYPGVVYHISAGDCLREERQRADTSETGQLIERYIREGAIVPVEITVKLLRAKMFSLDPENGIFLIDGFPRNEDNLKGWFDLIGHEVHTMLCLNYVCSDKVLENRILHRSESSGRVDDNVESVRKRFITFHRETEPILNFFRDKHLISTIDADRPIEEVWCDSQNVIEEFLQNKISKNQNLRNPNSKNETSNNLADEMLASEAKQPLQL